jgi:predicted phosphodiesterase
MTNEFQIISDIHLEFYPNFKKEILQNLKTDADYLILAGDICEARNFQRFSWFFEWCSKNYNKVFMVLGNHESYYSTIHTLLKEQDSLSRTAQYAGLVPNLLLFELLREHNLNNIYLMSSFEPFQIDENTFILGDTAWTNYDNGNPLSILNADRMMNDKKAINKSSQYFYEQHIKVIDELKKQLEKLKHKKVILVTHHPITTNYLEFSKYKGDKLNGAFNSDYNQLILANPQIKIVCSGHTHDSWFGTIGKTQYIINPFGYNSESKNYSNLTFII